MFHQSFARHDLHARGDLKRRTQRAVHRTALRVNPMHALHRIAHRVRIFGAQRVRDVYPLDDQHATLVLHFAANLATQPAMFCIDFARIQRATEGAPAFSRQARQSHNQW